MIYFKRMVRITSAALIATSSVCVAANPLKVYILVGQSNMQGQAKLSTIPHMAMDPVSRPLHDKLVDAAGRPRVFQDVSISAISMGGGWSATIPRAKQGPLTVGYGGPLEDDETFGPELAFGVTIREASDAAILIIKASWGGKSLYTDFRPPSAGERPVPADLVARWEKAGNYEEELAKYKEATGRYYRLMIEHVKNVLSDPGAHCDAYDPEHGLEVAGFVWFQGFNDQFEPYPHLPATGGEKRGPKDYSEYSRLLSLLIKDVRNEVKAPDMPVVIGVMGIGGKDNVQQAPIRRAMAAPTEMPEFKGNVVAVHTANYWDDELVAAADKASQLWKIRNDAYNVTPEGDIDYDSVQAKGWQSVCSLPPAEKTWRYVSLETDSNSHYRDLREGEEGDVRVFKEDVPAEYTGWMHPDFDVSGWQEGPGPIGKGTFFRNRGTTVEAPEIHSDWGTGNMVLMRRTIELDDPSEFTAFRICMMANASYNIYLNGHKVADYVWWKTGHSYRAFELTDEQIGYLRKGPNVLAVQANILPNKQHQEVNWVNLLFEGLSKEDHAKLIAMYDRICTTEDKEIAKGKSNQSYHYMGSAKIYSRIGEAFAKALITLGR